MKEINLYRRNGKKVYIKQPTFEELEYTARLWGDEETMAEIGGAYIFPKEKWEMFYKKMVHPTDGKNFYCLIYTNRNKAIGEVSFHGFDSITRVARINIKINHRHRNKGYGEEALRLILEYYFQEFGGEVVLDNITTESGKKLFEKVGFKQVSKFRDQCTYKITRGDFVNIISDEPKSVAVLCYDNMNITNYSIIIDILKLTNKIVGRELFNIFTVGDGEKIQSDNINIVLDKTVSEINDNVDIIILPGGSGADLAVKNKYNIRYLLANYNDCDYVLSIDRGILFLNRGRMLDDMVIPEIYDLDTALLDMSSNYKVISNKFIDGGKIMMASNSLGAIKGTIEIVKKVAGEEIALKVENVYS